MNRVNIQMDSRPENISFARVVVAGFIAPLDPSVDEISDIKTAVSEAVTNAIIHGYPENSDAAKPGTVHISLTATGRTITIEVADNGVGIADIETAREPLFTTKAELERSGLGFTVMESFMDSVVVKSTPGQGTTITLAKTLASQE